MKTEQIWVVSGSTGEYSGRTEWMVDAWHTELEAQARVQELTERFRAIVAGRKLFDLGVTQEVTKHMLESDLGFQTDYCGAYYYINEVTLNEPTN
jgi:hypothetical protein